jgi:hypothetical protein
MDFLSWWFDKHYIYSLFFTPGMSFAWCIWSGDLGWRPVIAAGWALTSMWIRMARIG